MRSRAQASAPHAIRRMQAIRTKPELCRVIAMTLMQKLDSFELTANERQANFRRRIRVTLEGEALELAFELQRERKRNARGLWP